MTWVFAAYRSVEQGPDVLNHLVGIERSSEDHTASALGIYEIHGSRVNHEEPVRDLGARGVNCPCRLRSPFRRDQPSRFRIVDDRIYVVALPDLFQGSRGRQPGSAIGPPAPTWRGIGRPPPRYRARGPTLTTTKRTESASLPSSWYTSRSWFVTIRHTFGQFV